MAAVTPCSYKYSLMLSSDSLFRAVSLIMPLDEFDVLCSETSTGKLKKGLVFSKFSVWFEFFELSQQVAFGFLTFSPTLPYQKGLLFVFQ